MLDALLNSVIKDSLFLSSMQLSLLLQAKFSVFVQVQNAVTPDGSLGREMSALIYLN